MNFIFGVFIGALVFAVINRIPPRDDTDPPGKRSGLALYTDAKTGMQYLGTPGGGITPRLNSDGHHVRQRAQ